MVLDIKYFKIETSLVSKYSKLAIFGLLIGYLGKIWYDQRLFKRLGIPTPKFRYFFGHLPEILSKTQSNALREWTKLFGKTYGMYEGHLPVLVTSDPEIIQEVFVKQFHSFMARKIYPFQFSDHSCNMDLFLSSNKRWKRMRNIINPTFSPLKIKELIPIMKHCTERFLSILETKTDEEIIISEYLNRYTMDIIWNSAVGVDIDCQHNINNDFVNKSLLVFKDLEDLKLEFILTTYFSEFRPQILSIIDFSTYIFKNLNNRFVDPLFWLTQHIHQALESRQKNKVYKRDFTQLLIEAQDDSFEIENKDSNRINIKDLRIQKKMSFDEIKFNLVGFLLAGFETTSTALTYCFYVLSTLKSEMLKLQKEIDSFYLNSNDEPSFDNINKLEYLDMFIKEVLRMYPISSNTVNRRCMYPTKIKDIDFPVGLSITVDVLSLHYDPEHWQDPQNFNPERFSPEFKINQYVYLPWGVGPKNCVGMRFAILEMKLFLAKLLLTYDVLPAAEFPTKLEYVEGTVRRPKNEIKVKFRKRSNLIIST